MRAVLSLFTTPAERDAFQAKWTRYRDMARDAQSLKVDSQFWTTFETAVDAVIQDPIYQSLYVDRTQSAKAQAIRLMDLRRYLLQAQHIYLPDTTTF